VAEAIVDALRFGTVEVWVPKRSRRTNQLVAVLPRRLSESMGRALKADRVLAEADTISRRDYELRASRSEPGLEAGAEQPQIPTTAGD
jgi:hypothetical protein